MFIIRTLLLARYGVRVSEAVIHRGTVANVGERRNDDSLIVTRFTESNYANLEF